MFKTDLPTAGCPVGDTFEKGDTEVMKKMRSVVVAVVASVLYCIPFSAAMAKDEVVKTGSVAMEKDEKLKVSKASKAKDDAVKISKASKVVKEIAAIPKMKIPPDLLNDSSAIVLVPGAAKLNFKVSGGSSGGVMLVHDKDGTWSSPVFITISGGSLGWQIVPEQMDIVLVFRNRKSVDAILKGKFTMDTKIAIVPGRLGPSMKAATAKDLKAEVASYVRSRGAFLEEAVVAGATVQIDVAANDAFYAKPKVEVGDIVSGSVIKSTEDVKILQKLLTDYSAIK
jgi:lipid-binding SYLF domain-containing protein